MERRGKLLGSRSEPWGRVASGIKLYVRPTRPTTGKKNLKKTVQNIFILLSSLSAKDRWLSG